MTGSSRAGCSISGFQRTRQVPRPGSSTSLTAALMASWLTSSSTTISSAFSMTAAAVSMSFCSGMPRAAAAGPVRHHHAAAGLEPAAASGCGRRGHAGRCMLSRCRGARRAAEADGRVPSRLEPAGARHLRRRHPRGGSMPAGGVAPDRQHRAEAPWQAAASAASAWACGGADFLTKRDRTTGARRLGVDRRQHHFGVGDRGC